MSSRHVLIGEPKRKVLCRVCGKVLDDFVEMCRVLNVSVNGLVNLALFFSLCDTFYDKPFVISKIASAVHKKRSIVNRVRNCRSFSFAINDYVLGMLMRWGRQPTLFITDFVIACLIYALDVKRQDFVNFVLSNPKFSNDGVYYEWRNVRLYLRPSVHVVKKD